MIAKYGNFEYALAEHYRFEDVLGQGAMGTVYRARDVRLGRPVAIKMLHPFVTNEIGVARFQGEIRIAAGLHHPNIIGVHDCGEADGLLYYVMDFLGGETLRDRLNREKQLSVDDALRIIDQIADGLQHAHDHDVVHRDVKPENILLADGRACLADFGLARALGDSGAQRLTASGLSVGTPHYLSPEQAAADKDVGPKADQYGLACVLYEMLAGEPPFTGPTATSIAMRHISEEPRQLGLRRRTTPTAVQSAVMRALEKVPADRFASVTAFAHATHGPVKAVGDDGLGARPSSEVPATWIFLRGLGRRVVAVAILVLAALALGLGAYLSRDRVALVDLPSGPIRVALLPLVSAASPDRPRVAAVMDGIASGLRMFGGIVGLSLPTSVLAEDAESNPVDAIAMARRRGARYVVLLGGFSNRADGVRIEILDTRTGASFGHERVATDSRSSDISAGTEVAVGIARAIVSRDSLFARGFRSVLQSTRSAQALSHLVEGQRRFGRGDIAGANTEYRSALHADSACVLAYYRLSGAAAWDNHYAEALALADSGLRRAAVGDERARRLLRAQRFYAMRMTDSAIAGFVFSVADDPDNVDGWFGLSQSMFNLGWEAGFAAADARTSLDRVLYLDSTFAPIHHFVVDVALATGDTAAAKAALRGIGAALPWRPAKELLVRYALGGAASRDSVLRELERSDHYTLSELVLQFSRTLGDMPAADRAAAEMRALRRPPESRRRGTEYQLALSVVLGRDSHATRDLVAGLAGDQFDAWLGAAALSGLAPDTRSGLRKAAWALIPPRLTATNVSDASFPVVQAIDYLIQDALDDPSTQRAAAIGQPLKQLTPASEPSNPSIYNWQESLAARFALSRADTVAAIGALQRAIRRVNEPYGAFQPLASLPAQRLLLARLLRATNAARATIDEIDSSFQRSWSIADALFNPRSAAHTSK